MKRLFTFLVMFMILIVFILPVFSYGINPVILSTSSGGSSILSYIVTPINTDVPIPLEICVGALLYYMMEITLGRKFSKCKANKYINKIRPKHGTNFYKASGSKRESCTLQEVLIC